MSATRLLDRATTADSWTFSASSGVQHYPDATHTEVHRLHHRHRRVFSQESLVLARLPSDAISNRL